MIYDLIFTGASLAAGVAWLLIAYRSHTTHWSYRVGAVWIPAGLCILYALLMLPHVGTALSHFGSLSDVGTILQNPHFRVAAWIHYFAFDLLVGSWQVREANRRLISRLKLAPCLFLTFLLGPVGLLLFMLVRSTSPAVRGTSR